jgi:uncharacterized NAD(P)/FAD-binding protein YdhS
MGSRGLTVLERCLKFAGLPEFQETDFLLNVVEPKRKGEGVHMVAQPDYLLLNTVCGLPTLYPGPIFESPELARPGPSFLEWLRRQGYKLQLRSGQLSLSQAGGREIEPGDFIPRNVFGLYLRQSFEDFVKSAPCNVRIAIHDDSAIQITGLDTHERVVLGNGKVLEADYVFLTTGHTPNRYAAGRGDQRTIVSPYPVDQSTGGIAANDAVGIGGMGLTAMDVIAALTVGRGGAFRKSGTQCVYLPSGKEPRLFLFSNTGLPYRPRPRDDDGGFDYSPIVCTAERVIGIRQQHPEGIDFEEQIWPLLELEIRVAYYLRQVILRDGPAAAALLRTKLIQSIHTNTLPAQLSLLRERLGDFDVRADLWPDLTRYLQSAADYQRWFVEQLRNNQLEAEHGFALSAATFARELMLHLRDVVRLAVNYRGLSAASHEWFAGTFVPAVNRNVIGPQLERNEELCALIEAGVVSLETGPAPRLEWSEDERCWTAFSTSLDKPTVSRLNWLIHARADAPSIANSASPLLAQLFDDGRIRKLRTASLRLSGLEVDEDSHPVDAAGCPNMRLFALGPICEGSTYYNHYVPTHVGASTPFVEAHQAVRAMLRHAKREGRAASLASSSSPVAKEYDGEGNAGGVLR